MLREAEVGLSQGEKMGKICRTLGIGFDGYFTGLAMCCRFCSYLQSREPLTNIVRPAELAVLSIFSSGILVSDGKVASSANGRFQSRSSPGQAQFVALLSLSGPAWRFTNSAVEIP